MENNRLYIIKHGKNNKKSGETPKQESTYIWIYISNLRKPITFVAYFPALHRFLFKKSHLVDKTHDVCVIQFTVVDL